MCARCTDGWNEMNVNGEYITADFCDCPEGAALKNEMGKMWEEVDKELEEDTVKIVETILCTNCFDKSVDILIKDGEVSVIGGCVNCDYMPSIEEVHEALEFEDYRGIDEMAIVSEYY